jgi:hypothetical protein
MSTVAAVKLPEFARTDPAWLDGLDRGGLRRAGLRVWRAIHGFFRNAVEIVIKDKDVCKAAKMGRRNVQKGWVQLEQSGDLERIHTDDGDRIIRLKVRFPEKEKAPPKEAKTTAKTKPSEPAAGDWKDAPREMKQEVHEINDELQKYGKAIESWDRDQPRWRDLSGIPERLDRAPKELFYRMHAVRHWFRAWIAAGRPRE